MTTISDITKELQDKGLSQEDISQFVIQMNNLIGCGETCQRDNKIDSLKKDYESAENTLKTAPKEVNEARKNYFTYAYGDTYYNNYQRDQYKKEAIEEKQKIEKLYNENTNQINDLITNNEVLKFSKKNVNELINKYLASNGELIDLMDDEKAKVKTSDRKVYYENTEIERLVRYNTYLTCLYWGLILVLIIIFIDKKLYSNKSDIIILTIFIIVPFIIRYAVRFGTSFVKKLITYIPKNVYLKL